MYDRLASSPDGSRALAQARLRRETLRALHRAQAASGLSVEEIADVIGGRRRDVRRDFDGNGNLKPDMVARYLHAMGCELELRLVPVGEPRRAVVEECDVQPTLLQWWDDRERRAEVTRWLLGEGSKPTRPWVELRAEIEAEQGITEG